MDCLPRIENNQTCIINVLMCPYFTAVSLLVWVGALMDGRGPGGGLWLMVARGAEQRSRVEEQTPAARMDAERGGGAELCWHFIVWITERKPRVHSCFQLTPLLPVAFSSLLWTLWAAKWKRNISHFKMRPEGFYNPILLCRWVVREQKGSSSSSSFLFFSFPPFVILSSFPSVLTISCVCFSLSSHSLFPSLFAYSLHILLHAPFLPSSFLHMFFSFSCSFPLFFIPWLPPCFQYLTSLSLILFYFLSSCLVVPQLLFTTCR